MYVITNVSDLIQIFLFYQVSFQINCQDVRNTFQRQNVLIEKALLTKKLSGKALLYKKQLQKVWHLLLYMKLNSH